MSLEIVPAAVLELVPDAVCPDAENPEPAIKKARTAPPTESAKSGLRLPLSAGTHQVHRADLPKLLRAVMWLCQYWSAE